MTELNIANVPEEEELSQEEVNSLRQIRLDKLDELRKNGKDPFVITKFDVDSNNKSLKAQYEQDEAKAKAEAGDDEQKLKDELEKLKEKKVTIAGRIMSWRDMGKANFIDIRDTTDRMQVYVRMNDIGETEFAEFKKWDIGDIVGIKGFVFRTRRGEISVHAEEITLLSKSLLPLPEKWHGLKDRDQRYRQRYTDLICNPDVKQTFINRSKIIASIRRYLDEKNFIEVETPMLVSNAGGAAARPFETHYNALDEDVKLRISPQH